MLTLELDYEFAFEVDRLSKQFSNREKSIDNLEQKTGHMHFNVIYWAEYSRLLKKHYPELHSTAERASALMIHEDLRCRRLLNEKQEAIVGLYLASVGRDPSKWVNIVPFADDDNLWE